MSDYVTLTDKVVECRKDHRCDWCGEGIKAGDIARYRTGVIDGDITSDHKHQECWSAMMRSKFDTYDTYMPHDQKRGKTIEESDP